MLKTKARRDCRPSACRITRTAAKKATLMVALAQLKKSSEPLETKRLPQNSHSESYSDGHIVTAGFKNQK